MSLVAKKVTAVKAESDEGVAATLTAGDTIETLSYPSMTPNLEALSRAVSGGSLTQASPVSARQRASLEIPMELAGISTGVATTPPTWAPFFDSAAMKRTACKALKITGKSSGSGILAHDATCTFSPSTATARLIGRLHYGYHVWAFFEPLTGTIAADDDTFTDGSSVITMSGSDNDLRDAIAWEPWDDNLGQIGIASVTGGGADAGDLLVGGTSGARAKCWKSLAGAGTLIFERWLGSPAFVSGEVISATGGGTLTTNTGETAYSFPTLTVANQLPGIQKQIVGGRANWQINLENGSYAGLRFTVDGRLDQPTEVVPLAGPAKRGAKPPRVSGSSFKLNGQAVSCIKTLRIGSENTVALRECLTEPSGYKSSLITARKITGQIDPEAASEGFFPILGNAWNKTPFQLESIVGDVTAKNGNSFVIRGHEVTATNFTDADREGLAVHNIPLAFGGGTRDEFFLYAM